MRAFILGVALLAGCQAEPSSADPFAVDQAAVPVAPGSPRFVVGELVAGGTVHMMFADLPPGDTVFFAHGAAVGPGPCYPALLGGCLGITSPVQLVGTAVVNASGYAELTVSVPAALPAGSQHEFQAVAFSASAAPPELSDVVVRHEGLGFCTRIWFPVCGVDGVTYSNPCTADFAGVAAATVGAVCP